MKRPSSRTIAAVVGALTLSGVAVAAVAASDDAPEPSTTEPTIAPSSSPSISDSPAPSTPPDPAGSVAAADGLTSEQAIAIAEQALAELGNVPALREVERELEDGRDVWEVEFGRDHEVYIDAVTGEIVKIELDDDDDDRHGDDKDDDRHGRDDDGDDDHGDRYDD